MKVEVYWNRARLGRDPVEVHTVIDDAFNYTYNDQFFEIERQGEIIAIPTKEIVEYNVNLTEGAAAKVGGESCVH